MGDTAASGGYYIAAPGDAIFAEPSTITGSIGIFAFKVDVRRMLATVGVSVETYRRGAHADLLSPYRPWTDDEKKLIADKIRHLYDLFLATIEGGRKSRGITAARADQLGRGQVWTGAQALALGLVDRTGGLLAAIDHAAGLAGLRPVAGPLPEIVVLPRERSNLIQQALGLGAAVQDRVEGDDVLAQEGDGDGDGHGHGAELPAPSAADLVAGMLRGLLPGPALRMRAPLLLSSGVQDQFQARLPFDLDLR
jgi:protease-4